MYSEAPTIVRDIDKELKVLEDVVAVDGDGFGIDRVEKGGRADCEQLGCDG